MRRETDPRGRVATRDIALCSVSDRERSGRASGGDLHGKDAPSSSLDSPYPPVRSTRDPQNLYLNSRFSLSVRSRNSTSFTCPLSAISRSLRRFSHQ